MSQISELKAIIAECERHMKIDTQSASLRMNHRSLTKRLKRLESEEAEFDSPSNGAPMTNPEREQLCRTYEESANDLELISGHVTTRDKLLRDAANLIATLTAEIARKDAELAEVREQLAEAVGACEAAQELLEREYGHWTLAVGSPVVLVSAKLRSVVAKHKQ